MCSGAATNKPPFEMGVANFGSANHLNISEIDGETWVCHFNIIYGEGEYRHYQKYAGYGNLVDDFELNAEYRDSPNNIYNESSDFTYRNKSISMREYERLCRHYWYGEDEVVPLDDIRIKESSKENFSGVKYGSYNSDLGSDNFYFSYPTNVYKEVSHYYDIDWDAGYGALGCGATATLIEDVYFQGGKGSTLEYMMFKRTDGLSKEDMLYNVYSYEMDKIVVKSGANPDLIAPKVSDGYGLAVFTGWTLDETKIVYEVVDVEKDYILIMKVISPNTKEANSMTTELYNRCGFRKTKLWG